MRAADTDTGPCIAGFVPVIPPETLTVEYPPEFRVHIARKIQLVTAAPAGAVQMAVSSSGQGQTGLPGSCNPSCG